MARFCASCGTEVEDTAVFCPTCGQPIDQDAETEMPAAPAWPERIPDDESPVSSPADPERQPEARFEEPTRVEEAPPTASVPPAAQAAPRGPPQRERRSSPAVNLPFTMPVTLSAWLIGVGAAVAALGVIVGLFYGFLNPIDLILLLLLLGIAAAVFFASNVPAIPHLRLMTLVVVLIGFGMALDRISIGIAGVSEVLVFLGTAAAAIGAIILELGRDQPLGRPQR